MTTVEISVEDSNSWTAQDSQNLAQFLATDTGRRVLPAIVDQTPALLPSGDVNAILIRSGEVRGVALAIHTLHALAHPAKPVANQSSEYPPPEDDSAWAGEKINPPPGTQT